MGGTIGAGSNNKEFELRHGLLYQLTDTLSEASQMVSDDATVASDSTADFDYKHSCPGIKTHICYYASAVALMHDGIMKENVEVEGAGRR